MVFYDGSPRRCSMDEALRIAAALRRRVELCGVFVNAPLEEVVRVSERAGLDACAAARRRGPAFCLEVARRTGAEVIKAAQVADAGDVRDRRALHIDFHLLDARATAPDGRAARGHRGDLRLGSAQRAAFQGAADPQRRPGPGNVAEAIALVRPFAVDTASGTEAAPGHKDPEQLRGFFAVRWPSRRAIGSRA